MQRSFALRTVAQRKLAPRVFGSKLRSTVILKAVVQAEGPPWFTGARAPGLTEKGPSLPLRMTRAGSVPKYFDIRKGRGKADSRARIEGSASTDQAFLLVLLPYHDRMGRRQVQACLAQNALVILFGSHEHSAVLQCEDVDGANRDELSAQFG
jgi:hypothetical protein